MLADLIKDCVYIFGDIGYIIGAKDAVVMGDHWLKFGVKDGTIKINNKRTVILSGEACCFI